MENKFKENSKFWSLDGIICRRDFIVNFFIIEIVECLLFFTPYLFLVLLNPTILSGLTETINSGTIPTWYSVWSAIIGLISSILYFPSIVRRLRDITSSEDNQKIYLASAGLCVIIFGGYIITSLNKTGFNSWLSFTIILALMFMKGKITSKKPKSEIIKFNWGAFFGTWIWGLFNKTPITLWMIPLCFTLGWLPFMIICGLKGNQWAWENSKKHIDIGNFHNEQSKQATIWCILYPIILLISSIAILFTSAITLGKYAQNHPDFEKRIETKAMEMSHAAAKGSFSKIEFTEDEYKFYINPKVWIKLTKKQKSSIFQTAVSYTINELKLERPTDKNAIFEQSTNIAEKVKIYSNFNNELLARYILTVDDVKKALDNIGEKGGFKRYMNLLQNAYEFNNNPSLP